MFTDLERAEIVDLINKTVSSATKDTVKEVMTELGVPEAMQAISNCKKPTKEEIMKVKSRSERQKLISENMELFR